VPMGGDLVQPQAAGIADPEGAPPADNGPVSGRSPGVVAAGEWSADVDGEPDRRGADRELVEVLRACGFAGVRYDLFAEELARYGVSVLCGWMYSGYVFALAARQGFSLHPAGHELDELHRDPVLRQDLAVMVVAVALRRFRDNALIGGGWRADGGASLTTYFLGTCLLVFPNEFRRHRAQSQRWQAQDAVDQATGGSEAAADGDPAELVTGTISIRAELARADPRTRAIVALRMDGYHQEEIAEMLSEKSARAVEGVLYRWRGREIKRRREAGEQ
jgi:hypothetical protein